MSITVCVKLREQTLEVHEHFIEQVVGKGDCSPREEDGVAEVLGGAGVAVLLGGAGRTARAVLLSAPARGGHRGRSNLAAAGNTERAVLRSGTGAAAGRTAWPEVLGGGNEAVLLGGAGAGTGRTVSRTGLDWRCGRGEDDG